MGLFISFLRLASLKLAWRGQQPPAPYPDASKAVEEIAFRLRQRMEASALRGIDVDRLLDA